MQLLLLLLVVVVTLAPPTTLTAATRSRRRAASPLCDVGESGRISVSPPGWLLHRTRRVRGAAPRTVCHKLAHLELS